MADIAEPGTCQACRRALPPQQGRGRIRRYCDARCRDAARRERARREQARTEHGHTEQARTEAARTERGGAERRGASIVKNDLTVNGRHEYLDAIDGTSSAGDPAAHRVTDTARRLIAEFTRATSPGAAVAAALELSAAAEAALQEAVDRARAAGQSWRDIGDMLGTTRQAAFQRFGHPVDPRTGQPMTRGVPSGTLQRVTAFLDSFTAGQWDEVLGEFDEPMRARHDADRLASGWAHLIGMFGSYQGMGKVSPVPASGGTAVVDVRLDFEAGESMVWVRFSRDGKVTGLRLHPPSP
jgi:Protein of unknown function (DUF3887)